MKFKKYYCTIDENSILEKSKKFNIEYKVMEIIMSRGYVSDSEISNFLCHKNNKYHDPFTLNGMAEAIKRIKEAIANKERITIFGDYDVDGISATAVMIKTFGYFNIEVSHFLPNRFIDGYGVTKETIDKVVKNFNPSLIITVDCGISCHDEVEYAKSLGVDVIVTDHHEIPAILPDCIVINPKLNNQKYPFNDLCGTGVAFKVAQALLGIDNAQFLLPIVGIATIADIVSLTDENRLIVKDSFSLMEKYLPIGLKRMFDKNKVNFKKLQASDIAFKIAPKLNASGRMGDAEDSLLLYLQTNSKFIDSQIDKINNHNLKRQELCNDVYEDCKEMLRNKNISEIRNICLYSPNWDQGILGIVCARLMEEYNCPVFLFSKLGNELKGSGRSIKDINIHTMLSSLQDILTTFGGHSVAAGLTLDISKFNEFVRRINEYVYTNINDSIFCPIKYYDCELSTYDLTDKFYNDLQLIEPCGAGNPKPQFLIQTEKINLTPLKNFQQHANINIGDNLNLIYFNYINNSSKLRLSNNHKFIFEITEKTKTQIKGSVKQYVSDFSINKNYFNLLESFKFNQVYGISDNIKYSTYPKDKLIDFIALTQTSVFGTAFVCYNPQLYSEFKSNYDMSSVYNFNLINDLEKNAFNAIFIAPDNYNWAKNYSNIIFIDEIIDESFISQINQISNAKIFIPNTYKSTNIFNSLNLNRSYFITVFNELKKHTNKHFISVLGLFNLVKKNIKITFNNFYLIFLVFKELNIINYNTDNLFNYITLDNNKKTRLESSKLYSFCKLINKVKGD